MTKKTKTKQKQAQELTRLGKALRSLGGIGGSAVGNLVGQAEVGRNVGTGLGASLSRWLGSGDYTVRRNSVVASLKASDSIPSMHSSGQNIVVRHKEFLGEIQGSGTFNVRRAIVLNPGYGDFPWLAGIACKFQEYRIKGLVFHYVPNSGDAVSSTPAVGNVMMQTSYRATDVAPSSKVEMLNEYWSNDCIPSEAFAHPVECNPRENPFNTMYVRSGPVPSGDSKLNYDLGTTYVAVSGNPSVYTLGDLWATYEVELSKPVVNTNVSGGGYDQVWVPTSMYYLFSGLPAFNGFSFSDLNVIFPDGEVGPWRVDLLIIGSGMTATFSTNLHNVSYVNFGSGITSPRYSCAATALMYSGIFSAAPVPNDTCWVSPTLNLTAGSMTSASVRISKV